MKCEICNSENKVVLNTTVNKYLCSRHNQQIKKYGEIRRSKYDPNEIVEYVDYAEVVLYNINNLEIARTIIDKEDIYKIKKHKWRIGNGYVFATIDRKNVGMHRYIMDAPDDKIVDHINRDKLDNRRQNLRICSYKGNNRNKRMLDANTSGITGVYYSNRDSKWIVQIKENNKAMHLGAFDDIDYARIIRLKAEQILFKQFSPNKHLFFQLNQYDELKNIKTIDELKSHLNIGYNNGHVLTEEDVYKIKLMLSEGNYNQSEIARMFNVNKTAISRIKLGKVWNWVKIQDDKTDKKNKLA